MGPRRLRLGFWKSEREAAEAYDRAVLHYRGPDARRNFPDRLLAAADEITLRTEARRRVKLRATSKFRGVRKLTTSWLATIAPNRRDVSLGAWQTEIEAAEAYDRGARYFFGPNAHLNFPDGKLPSTPPAELLRLARLARKRTATSRYLGVRRATLDVSNPWLASIVIRGRRRNLGSWGDQETAARAYDRAARFYLGPAAPLNFPDENAPAADAATLKAESRREVKRGRSSRYVGVCWAKGEERWRAGITHEGRRYFLGLFTDERSAAEAYDERSIGLRGGQARINFHPITGKQVWGKRLNELVPAARI